MCVQSKGNEQKLTLHFWNFAWTQILEGTETRVKSFRNDSLSCIIIKRKFIDFKTSVKLCLFSKKFHCFPLNSYYMLFMSFYPTGAIETNTRNYQVAVAYQRKGS